MLRLRSPARKADRVINNVAISWTISFKLAACCRTLTFRGKALVIGLMTLLLMKTAIRVISSVSLSWASSFTMA
eukprot:4881350-Karenia_brevis.AAC.1